MDIAANVVSNCRGPDLPPNLKSVHAITNLLAKPLVSSGVAARLGPKDPSMSSLPIGTKLTSPDIECFQIDPLGDTRWAEFILAHQRSSVFHSLSWLRALRDAYDYRPLVFTTSAPRTPLQNGILFCLVESWVTGRRLVSL